MTEDRATTSAASAAQGKTLSAASTSFQLGIIGDLHTHWDDVDVAQFNRSDYDLLYFTGDLGGGTPDSSLRVARVMARLDKPTLVMPGNNDCYDMHQLAAELTHQQGMNRLLSMARDDDAPAAITVCGYSEHRISVGERTVSLVAARPHSMGGPDLTFPEFMGENYGVHSIDDSRDRLFGLVDEAADELIFLSHNGPLGLGDEPADMFGCDFREGGGDWGDHDLASVVGYARSQGKRVLAVIAGHMHLRTKQGEQRDWQRHHEETLYINAALVPRIFSGKDDVYRHHLRLSLTEQDLQVEEMLIPQYG